MNGIAVETPPAVKRQVVRKRPNRRLKLLVGLAVPVMGPMVLVGQAWANGCCCG